MSSLPSDAPAPRHCIIVKWPDFEGYGFNLHAEKSKPGQYIGKVDENSPAEKAGLLEDDRIIEVNGVNIANENHKQVVKRIKAVPNETRLLVVDPAADKYYKDRNIVVRGTQDNVITRSSVREEKAPPTPEPQTQAPPTSVSNGHHEEIDNRSVSSAASSSAASETSTQPQPAAALAEADKDSTVEEEVASKETMEKETTGSPSEVPAEEAENPSEEILTPEEDAASLSGSDKVSENDISAPVEEEESLPEPSETDSPQLEESVEGREQTLPEPDASHEEEVQQQTEEEKEEEEEEEEEKKEEEEEEKEKEEEIKVEATPEQESDLEAEYDNVEIDAGRAEVAASQATSDSRRLSASSGESHSSHGSDTARTDPPTQSPMSTSPTPPPSLESAPEPVRISPQATLNNTAAATTTTATTTTKTSTTNNASPKSQPVSNNNNYNSSGLNLNMSAAEMRAMLARKKKTDPRKETVDLKTKYEIIQNM